MNNRVVLYIGGFALPDKNAAAQRVIGIAKGLKELGYKTVFLHSRAYNSDSIRERYKAYWGFPCLEYKREPDFDYCFTGKTCISRIQMIKPDYVIAYNYPGFALENIRRYCKKARIRCYADTTEWNRINYYGLRGIIRGIDTFYRMRIVHKRMDGIIAISGFLYGYYKKNAKTIMIPPTVDASEQKWIEGKKGQEKGTVFIYAGSPSVQKEKLDLIVEAFERVSAPKTIRFNIVGITEKQFKEMYHWNRPLSSRIVFWGRLDHNEAIGLVSMANWSIIIRDNNWVVNAGFPTKLVESITCGTPVIINNFSNVTEYLNDSNSIICDGAHELIECISRACKTTEGKCVDRWVFDYHKYLAELNMLLS